jgi:parallel beta-helix repeat protein
VLVEKCSIHDLGYFNGAAIALDRGKRGTVRGCDIWNIGGHGVSVNGGNQVKLERCEHVVDNCYIHHVGQFNRHGIGVILRGVGIRVSHNLIHDMPRCGIFHGGALNTLEYNRIRHCNLEMEDTGCTYTGGWTGGWQTIRYNHCSDSIGFNNHGQFFVFAWGIYLDESGCGNDVYGNIVERCQEGAMHLHNARENHIENNIFVSNAGPQGKTHQLSLQTWNDSPTGVFLTDRQPKMLKEYEKLMVNPAWASMRGMHVSPANPFLPDGTIMRGNRISKNIFYYPNQPNSRYISENGVNLQYNTIDYNTVWNGGAAPVKTGKQGFKQVVADLSAKIPNIDFSRRLTEKEVGRASDRTVAADWFWYQKIFPNLQAEIVARGGKNALRLPGAFNPEKKYIRNTCVRSAPFTLTPGKHYRLTFQWPVEGFRRTELLEAFGYVGCCHRHRGLPVRNRLLSAEARRCRVRCACRLAVAPFRVPFQPGVGGGQRTQARRGRAGHRVGGMAEGGGRRAFRGRGPVVRRRRARRLSVAVRVTRPETRLPADPAGEDRSL